MWSFFHHYSFDEIGFLNGAVDYHCHILPGVDDGVRNLDKSLAALSYYEEAGVTEVWLTPHIMEDYPNSTWQLRQGFNKLCDAYNGPLIMHLASENMLDSTFEQRFPKYGISLAGSIIQALGKEVIETPNGEYSRIRFFCTAKKAF